MRNGPSRGPRRRFWVKQHPISNPSIPSQAGSLFTGAGKHRNPFLVRVSHGCNKNLDRRSFGECGETEAVINMYCGLGSFRAERQRTRFLAAGIILINIKLSDSTGP